jgi:hypothetical protein
VQCLQTLRHRQQAAVALEQQVKRERGCVVQAQCCQTGLHVKHHELFAICSSSIAVT